MAEIISIRECEKLYPDEWLLFEVMEYDEQHLPLKGRLIAHSKDRDEIQKSALQIKPATGYTLYSGDPIPEGMAVVL